ncbi:MAG: cryptochrome/photolyase family protein [Candidatus Caenarcaniphilales bacterium]|nr:cryptochrome/photolyase family protein [Candidatus Caenarcaniphilales bacterium]
MANLIWVVGDQLNIDTNLLRTAEPGLDQIVMIESREFASRHYHHKKKLIFQFSAMRHFAQELRERGFEVRYIDLKDKLSSQSFEVIWEKLLSDKGSHGYDQFLMMEGAEFDFREAQGQLQKKLAKSHPKLKTILLTNDLFLLDHVDLDNQFVVKKNLLMETFYRHMRRKHDVLMQSDGKPVGGSWNYDKENRQSLSGFSAIQIKYTPDFEPDSITQEVIEEVEKFFPNHYGKSEAFRYAVNREQALKSLRIFSRESLPLFGNYQDAMSVKHWHLYHSLLSYLLNFGLMKPLEVIRACEQEYHSGHAPLNAVEGFIRQILGWREYVYGVYWSQMPSYRELNFFNLTRPLPDFLWTGKTKMNCLRHAVDQTIHYAYAHHIQRLMVIGNFCLLAGINPQEVCEWYLIVYIDALEWVELPNTLGMSQFGDGGIMATKPYVSSGNYINRMSDYCKDCHYDVKQPTGEAACPFNYLYWNFLDQHKAKFTRNPRMGIALKNLTNKSEAEMQKIRASSEHFLVSEELKQYRAN